MATFVSASRVLVESLHKLQKVSSLGVRRPVLGGSWVVISGVISPLTITLLKTTHEPASTASERAASGSRPGIATNSDSHTPPLLPPLSACSHAPSHHGLHFCTWLDEVNSTAPRWRIRVMIRYEREIYRAVLAEYAAASATKGFSAEFG